MTSSINHWIPQWDLPNIVPPLNLVENCGFLGSCFADSISAKFNDLGFSVWSNPGGTLYNPKSINQQIQRLLSLQKFSQKELEFHNGIFHHLDFDTQFSHPSAEVLLDMLNLRQYQFKQWFKTTKRLFISLGTTGVYNLKDSNKTVSNCHKLPRQWFTEQQLSLEECDHHISQLIRVCKENGVQQILFTLSPVRYPKLGLANNSLAKATLRLAIEKNCNHNNIHYLPIGEILLDELRDFRFYDKDLKHPNQETQDYLFERTCDALLDQQTREYIRKAQQLQKMRQHRPLQSWTHESHLAQIESKKRALQLWLENEVGEQKLPNSFQKFILEK